MVEDNLQLAMEIATPLSRETMKLSYEFINKHSPEEFHDDLEEMFKSNETRINVQELLLLMEWHINKSAERMGVEFLEQADLDYKVKRLTLLSKYDIEIGNYEYIEQAYALVFCEKFNTYINFELDRLLDIEEYHENREVMDGELSFLGDDYMNTNFRILLNRFNMISTQPIHKSLGKMSNLALDLETYTEHFKSTDMELEQRAESILLALIMFDKMKDVSKERFINRFMMFTFKSEREQFETLNVYRVKVEEFFKGW